MPVLHFWFATAPEWIWRSVATPLSFARVIAGTVFYAGYGIATLGLAAVAITVVVGVLGGVGRAFGKGFRKGVAR